MSTLIDINEIKDANSHNSAMALTNAWAKTFKNYALNEEEELTDDPASSFNIFLHLTAQGAAKMMYEQAARINETNESTAVLPKSLISKLSASDLFGVFGNPASTTIAFCVKKSDIIEQSVLFDEASGLRRLVVNKDMTITYESHPAFTLPYNVIINVKPTKTSITNPKTGLTTTTTVNNVYAYYEMPDLVNDGMRSIYGINNQYISSREMRFNGEVYVAFFLKTFQIERKELEIYVSDPETTDLTVEFENNLVGVEVYRKPVGMNIESLMTGTVEGTINTSQNFYNYSYDYKRNRQNYNLIFNKSENYKLNTGDKLRIIVYSTEGTNGNISFPYMAYNLNSVDIEYNQDLSIANQNAMLNIVTLAFSRDAAAINGRNQQTIEEIRTHLIEKRYSRGILITDQEIINAAKKYGFDAYKTRHDIINMYHRAIGMINYNGMTLSTGLSSFYFDLNKKGRLLKGYNYYLIEPSDVFKYDKDSQKFIYVPRYSTDGSETVESWDEYTKKYNEADDPESVMEASFPFFMRYDNTANPKIYVYDMNIKTTEFLSFTKYNEDYALDKIDISYLRVQRNPYRGVTDGTFNEDISNTYYLSFIVYTGENTLNKIYSQCHSDTENYVNSEITDDYNKQYIVFNIEMLGAFSDERYQIDPRRIKITNTETMLKDGYIAYQVAISTNNFISNDRQIQMNGIKRSNSLSSDFSQYYSMDTSVKFILTGRFSDIGKTSNYNCITYETDEVKLVDYITDFFGIDFDIRTDNGGYETYENDIPKTYENSIFLKNPTYDKNNKDTMDPNHYEYKVRVSYDGKIDFLPGIDENGNEVSVPYYEIAHNAGDIVYDYIPLTDVEYNNGPLENREYYICIDDFNQIYQKVENLEEFEDGVVYYRAVAQFKHKAGDYKIYDKITGELTDAKDLSNINHEYHTKEPTYTGILKNVSWINRLYFSNADMYETIRDTYLDLISKLDSIRKILFDGGIMHLGLKRTSGNSSKYIAYKLNDNTQEYIKNIALKFVFRVKFKDNSSIDYKKTQIVNATTNYVNNLGDNDLSIDGLFEEIKAAVPDIAYINLIKLNNYNNGEVQTIMNDTTVKTELLTVSQKIVTDSDGNITFEPDVTVNVVNSD